MYDHSSDDVVLDLSSLEYNDYNEFMEVVKCT